jgi:hypothetical protein
MILFYNSKSLLLNIESERGCPFHLKLLDFALNLVEEHQGFSLVLTTLSYYLRKVLSAVVEGQQVSELIPPA